MQAQNQPLMIAESQARLQFYGTTALSSLELLNLLINRPAREVWGQYRSLTAIAQAPWQELAELPGLGTATACRLKAAIELGRRLIQEDRGQRPQITSPSEAANLLMPEMRDLDQEQLRVLLLDTKNHVLDNVLIYIGNVSSSIIRVSEVLRPAVRLNATAVIVAHNHPSGDSSPSPEDIQVTRSIVEAGYLLGIEVLDHLIIGHNQFTSLKEKGLGGWERG